MGCKEVEKGSIKNSLVVLKGKRRNRVVAGGRNRIQGKHFKEESNFSMDVISLV